MRLVLDNVVKVDYKKYFYNSSFDKSVTRWDVLNYILFLAELFIFSYKITQETRRAIKYRDKESLKELLDINWTNLPICIAKTIKTSGCYSVTSTLNGTLESFNNKFKLILTVIQL